MALKEIFSAYDLTPGQTRPIDELELFQLEKNEDFLGDIHLELAKTLFDNGLIENCDVDIL